MASHLFLAAQSPHRPDQPEALEAFLAGAIAPDIRYLQPSLTREATHATAVGTSLAGPFGLGYRHHLAVDAYFYQRCRSGVPGRIGAMNCSILIELHAIRRLPSSVTVKWSPDVLALSPFGVTETAANEFYAGCARYIGTRDPDAAIAMMSAGLRERADRYLRHWGRWKGPLQKAAWILSPWLHRFLTGAGADADLLLGRTDNNGGLD